MAKFFFIIVVLSLVSLAFSAEIKENTDKKIVIIPKCPCKCFIARRTKRAILQCKKTIFYKYCQVIPCERKRGYRYVKGLKCCFKAPSSPPPKPSATPSPSSKPRCPCFCHNKRWKAVKDCKYRPWCKVVECDGAPAIKTVRGYIPKPRRHFKCCYKAL